MFENNGANIGKNGESSKYFTKKLQRNALFYNKTAPRELREAVIYDRVVINYLI